MIFQNGDRIVFAGDSVTDMGSQNPVGEGLFDNLGRSYVRVIESLLVACYPEYSFTAFMLECWMLSPELPDVLAPESNIVSFRQPYFIYPVKNSAKDAIFYVYEIHDKDASEIDIESLDESNSLRRGIKKKLMEKRAIYEFGGYIHY